MRSESVWLVMRRRRSRRQTQTSRPTDMTLDSGGDLLLAYSDERLCLPSDNCSLRDTERSINQHELRNRTRAPVRTPTYPHKPGEALEAAAFAAIAGQDTVTPR